jgi:glycosyltransferase involved in cell wall biosynthesis
MKVAFVKFAGMASGGIEKYLQTIAIMLKKENFDVDFYYTNAAPFTNGWVHPDNSNERIKLCHESGINLIPVHVEQKQGHHIPYEWINTDFFEKFDESKYDFIHTGRSGYPEYPFNLINTCPIVDSIHSFVGEDKPNIKKAILLCKWQAEKWAQNGGNIKKAEIIPSIVKVPRKRPSSIRQILNIPEDAFVYGLHQGNRDDIFSPNALLAYAKVQNPNNYYLMMGGCKAHRDMAQQLKLKNIKFVDFCNETEVIHDFIAALDVYAHARSDGEVCSAAIIEAMYHGKPVITHPALNMGHLEQVEGCGKVAHTLDEYANEMLLLENSPDYYKEKSEKTLNRYEEKYNYVKVEEDMVRFYKYLQL